MFDDDRETQARDIRLFVILGIAAGLLPVIFLGEWAGVVALYLVGPIAVAAPIVTAVSLLTRSSGWRVANNLVLIFLTAGTVMGLVTGVFFWVAADCGWSCDWPMNVPRILMVAVPLVIGGTFWSWLRAD